MKIAHQLFAVSLLLFISCSPEYKKIEIDDSNIYYQGRVNTLNPEFYQLYWPGSAIKLKITGGSIRAFLSNDKGLSYYNVMIDGKVDAVISVGPNKKPYLIAEDLPEREHVVELFRRTEYPTGATKFYGFEVSEDAQLMSMDVPEMQIVFIGNSITAGYANEDFSLQDRPDSIYTNNYSAYGAVVSRHFNANYQCITRSGIGFMAGWDSLIMPEIYNLTNPNDKKTIWKPRSFQKRVVVINLGQNDSWILANSELDAYQAWFGEQIISESDIIQAYKQFVKTIRSYYPESHIVCALGSMDAVRDESPWFGYVKKAVEELDDSQISTLKFPFLAKNTHPIIEDHQVMADILIKHIEDELIK